MSRLSPTTNIGGGSVSSLIRSANSLQTVVSDYQDKLASEDWTNSAKTASDYEQYVSYLKNRVNELQSTGTITNISKAATLSQGAVTARRSYVSAEITRQSDNVLEGNSSLYDKQNMLRQYYNMATNPTNGDPALAQRLRGNLDSLNVQIQTAEQTAAKAAQSIAKLDASAQAGGYNDAATAVEAKMQKLAYVFSKGGAGVVDSAIKDFVNDPTVKAAYKQAGIPLDAKPNIGSLYEGGMKIVAYYKSQAAAAIYPFDPNQASSYTEQASNILGGQTNFKSPFGSINLSDAQSIAQNPSMYVEKASLGKNGLPQYNEVQGDIKDYGFDKSGNLVPTPAGQIGTVWSQLTSQQKTQIEKQLTNSGFSYKVSNGNLNVALTDKTSKWLNPGKFGFSKNEEFTVIPTGQGLKMVQADSTGVNHLFSIAFDQRNLPALYEMKPNAQPSPVAGAYGFNQHVNTVTTSVPGVVAHVTSKTPSMMQRTGGGFNFTDAQGNPISAYTYAKMSGQTFRGVLSQMATKGDAYASQALKFAGNDAAYNPSTIPLPVANNWTSLTWGQHVNLQIPQAARTAGGSTLAHYQSLSGGGGQNIAAPNGYSIGHL